MVDPSRVRALLARLGERLDRLQRYAVRSKEDYLDDEEAVLASKYLLLTAIEDALAVANHLIASEGWRSPLDYADAFRALAEHDVVTRGLGRKLEAMARFRNLLVHVYADVDDARVHDFLREDLQDLRAFASAVLEAFPELGGEA